MARFRPPRDVPDLGLTPGQQARFNAWLRTAFVEIAEDMAALSRDSSDTLIAQETIDVDSPSLRRVTPPLGGMGVRVPPPSAANAGQSIRLMIEAPVGDLTVVSRPGTGDDGRVFQPTINGSPRATFSVAGLVVLTSNGVNDWKTDAEFPAESPVAQQIVAGADGADGTPGATGATGAPPPPATGSEDGFLSRDVFANAASTRVGTTIWGQTIQAATTWTTDADIPDGNWFDVIVWAAGGSGANGMFRDPAVNTNSISGPSGGGGGACNHRIFSRAELVAALPIAMTIAADAVATAVATTVTTSHNGTMGGPSHFGSLLSAFGGSGGRMNNNTATACGGGGLSHPGQQAITGTANLGGGAPATGIPGYGGYGGGVDGTLGAFSATGGGGGGGGVSTASVAGGAGGRAATGGGGGGGAGGAVLAGVLIASSNPGGAGGLATAGAPASENGGGGTAGAVGTTSLGGPGGVGADSPSPAVGGSGGGGGASASGNSGQGGAGGDGGFPAAGGGGGGSARGTAGTARGGLGGTGGGGCICVTAFF